LSGFTRRDGKPLLLVSVCLAAEPISNYASAPGEGLDRFVRFGLLSTPGDVERFGAELEAEMVEACRLRDALGIPGAYE